MDYMSPIIKISVKGKEEKEYQYLARIFISRLDPVIQSC